MWFSLEGFRASRRKQNHLKGLEEGASGGKKTKNKKTKSPPVDPPRLRGAGGTPCLPRAAAPTSGGIGEQKQSQTSRVVWGEVGEDLRRRDTGEPQRPPLSLRAAERPGQRQDAAAGTPEPRGRSLRPPRRLSSQAPARGHRAPRSPAARSLRTWPAAAAAAAALLLTYPFRTSPFATQLFARTGRRRQQQPPGSGRIVPAAPRRLQADALCRRRPRERPPRSPALRPSRLPETGNGCTPPQLPCGAVTRGRGPLPPKPAARPRRGPRELETRQGGALKSGVRPRGPLANQERGRRRTLAPLGQSRARTTRFRGCVRRVCWRGTAWTWELG